MGTLMPPTLDVHLQRGDSGARARDFEIHVAVVIFRAGDVGEHGVVVAFDHQAHGDARARRADRNARIHQRESEPPHTVAIDDDPFDSRMSETRRIAYGKSSSGGSTVHQRAFRQRAVADFAAAGTAQELHFADARTAESCSAA